MALLEEKIRNWVENIKAECEQVFASCSKLSDGEFGRRISTSNFSPVLKSYIFYRKKHSITTFAQFVSNWDEPTWERNLKKEGIL